MRSRRKVVVGALGAVAALALWRPAGAATPRPPGVGGGSGGGGGGRRERRPQPVGRDGRHAPHGQLRRLGLARPGRHLLRLLLELRPALRPVAGDVQVRARQGRRHARARPRRVASASPATTPRPGPTPCARASSSRTARPSPARTSSTPSSGRWTRRRSRTARRTSTTSSTCRATPRPYQDTDPNKLGLKAIETPDDRTIVFHLAKPFSGFDYFAQLPSTMPGAAGQGHRHASTRSTWSPRARTCSRPTTWARASRWCATRTGTRPPTRTASRCPTASRSQLNVNADDIDNRLHVRRPRRRRRGHRCAARGAGQDPRRPARSRRTRTPRCVARHVVHRRQRVDVAPLDNIHCRKAVQYAVDRTGYQRAYGGATGGDIATNLCRR